MGCSPGTPTKVFFRPPGEQNWRVITIENSPVSITTEQILEPTGEYCYQLRYRFLGWDGCNPRASNWVGPQGRFGPFTIRLDGSGTNFCGKAGAARAIISHHGGCGSPRSSSPITQTVNFNTYYYAYTSYEIEVLSVSQPVEAACRFTIKDSTGSIILQQTFDEGCPEWREECNDCPPETLECADCCLDCGEYASEFRSLKQKMILLNLKSVSRSR